MNIDSCGARLLPRAQPSKGQAVAVTITNAGNGEPQKGGRVASTIAFPYSDMNDAIAVAEGVLKGGGIALSRDQLAAAMGLSPVGGGFATKVATARLFGVIDAAAGKYQLTDIGHEMVDPGRRADAMVQAFLNVELYRKTYEEFRGKRLPPRPHGLEAAFGNFGVSPKNLEVARRVFDKSARMAGFFHNGDEDRLVMPFGVGPSLAESDAVAAKASADPILELVPPAASGPVKSRLHPLIQGMMDELPPPKSDWNKADQAEWLDSLAGLFRIIYKGADKGKIEVTIAAAKGSE